MPAWRITAVLPDAPGRARRLDAELVGRDVELALLRQAFARALGAQGCHLFTVLGPAGVGKSRLARELAAALADEATVLVGRCRPYGEGVTYWPLRDLVHAVGDLRAAVEEADAAVIEAAAGLGDTPAAPEEIARAVRRLLQHIARERPLVLVFEDIHWGERAFLDLVDDIAERTKDAPILLVCLARPELIDEQPTWGGGKTNATTIMLEPLDVEHAEQLVANLAGDALPPEARRTITEVAEGNPLFLEEMVAMAVAEGGATAVPPSINALLSARLERLPQAERETIAAASVVGRFFSVGAVTALAGDDVPERLAELERKDLIRSHPVTFAPSGGFRFRHILIRDAAYDALPKATRAAMHEQLAGWLAESAGSDRREVDELIGWHLERAYLLGRELGTADDGLGRRAYKSLTRVGRRALGRGDAAAAESLLTRALALPAPLDADRVKTRLDLVSALLERGELGRAEAAVARALDEATGLGAAALAARARIESAHVLFHLQPDQWEQTALATAEDAIAELTAAGDDAGLARAWMLVVIHHYIRGRSRDLQGALAQALDVAERSGDRRHADDLRVFAARSVVFGPQPVAEALAFCDTIGAGGADAGVIHGVRACLHAMAGRFEEARAAYRAGLAVLEELGRTRLLAVERAYAGTVELLADSPEAAERELRIAARSLKAIGDRSSLSTIAALLAAALHAQGRDDEALRWAEQSKRDASRADVVSRVVWRTTLARLEPQRSVELASEAVAVTAETDAIALQGDAHLCLSDALAAAGRVKEALAAAEQALRLYAAKGHVVGVARAQTRADALQAPEGNGGT